MRLQFAGRAEYQPVHFVPSYEDPLRDRDCQEQKRGEMDALLHLLRMCRSAAYDAAPAVSTGEYPGRLCL